MEKIRKNFKVRFSLRESGLPAAILSMAAAFLATFGKILGFSSSMNVAVAVLSGVNVIPAFLGSVLAYFLSGTLNQGIVQICSMLVIAAIRLIVPIGEGKNDPIFLSLVTTGTLMLFGCVMSAAVPSDTYTASLRMISALLCGCVVFIARNIQCRKENCGVFDLTGLNGVFLSLIYIMSISTLTSVPLPVLNLGRIAGTLSMLMAVRKYKNIGGAVVGALTTCGVLLCVPSLARNTLLLATSGLISGIFLQLGNLVMILVFLVASLVSMVAMGVNSDTFSMFADLLAGSMIYIALPMPLVKKLAKRVVGVKNSADVIGQTTSSKLNFASHTLSGIRGQLNMVTAAIDKRAKEQSLSQNVRRCVCYECDLKDVCALNEEEMTKSFKELENIINEFNCISVHDVRTILPSCTNSKLMCDTFNEIHSDMVAEKSNNIKIREMREFLAEQLSSMEDMLNDLSFRVGQVRSVDSALSTAVREYFANLGYPNAKACVYVDEALCQRVEVFLTADFKGDLVRITASLSEIIEYDLDLPVIVKADSLTKLSFAEIPKYYVEVKSFTASSSGEYSGDSFEILELNGNEKYIVLSDGMGTGKRARLDSVFSVSLVTRLLSSGVSMSTAHKMINSMLRVKGWEESFATLDLLKIDLSNGCAEFLKSGAADSYLCRDGGIKSVGSQAFPAGILPDCTPDTINLKLFDGDIILMMSDGVESSAAKELARFAAPSSKLSLDEIAHKIGSLALSVGSGKNQDDITIILAKINKKHWSS